MISGIAFDRPDRLSRLRAFPHDRFKLYTIVPIVRIELNSVQAIKLVSVVRVFCGRPGSVSIWSSRSSEHYLRRLRRSEHSYGNQAYVGTVDLLFNFLSQGLSDNASLAFKDDSPSFSVPSFPVRTLRSFPSSPSRASWVLFLAFFSSALRRISGRRLFPPDQFERSEDRTLRSQATGHFDQPNKFLLIHRSLLIRRTCCNGKRRIQTFKKTLFTSRWNRRDKNQGKVPAKAV